MKIELNTCDLPQTLSVSSPEDEKEMLSITEEGGKVTVLINSSSLSLMQSCWRKTQLELIRKIKARKNSTALDFGSAIHVGLEYFYRSSRRDRILTSVCKKNIDLLGFGEETGEHENCLCCNTVRAFVAEGRRLGLNLDPMALRSIPHGAYLLYHYLERYINDPFVVLEDEKGPLVERRVEYTLHDSPELKIIYFGSIDVILKNERTGDILITDHKTSSRVGSEFFNRIKPNHQYTGYVRAAQLHLGIDSSSFLVNCLQVKPKPKTSRGTPPTFPRQVTFRDEEDIKEFEETVISTTKELVRRLREDDWPIGPVSSCASFGGCPYLDVCSAPKKLRETIISSMSAGE